MWRVASSESEKRETDRQIAYIAGPDSGTRRMDVWREERAAIVITGRLSICIVTSHVS